MYICVDMHKSVDLLIFVIFVVFGDFGDFGGFA